MRHHSLGIPFSLLLNLKDIKNKEMTWKAEKNRIKETGIHLKGKIKEANKYIQLELHQFKKGCNVQIMISNKGKI